MIVAIGQVAINAGVCSKTMPRWDATRAVVAFRNAGRHRRYDLDASFVFRATGTYSPAGRTQLGAAAVNARESSGKQWSDLARLSPVNGNHVHANFSAVADQPDAITLPRPIEKLSPIPAEPPPLPP